MHIHTRSTPSRGRNVFCMGTTEKMAVLASICFLDGPSEAIKIQDFHIALIFLNWREPSFISFTKGSEQLI